MYCQRRKDAESLNSTTMKPLKHQEKFVAGYSGKRLLVHEGGTGKTVCGCLWLKDGRDADALVICPKRVVSKWEKALSDWGAKGTVLSKEQFKKTALKRWSAVVLDEADEFASPLFTKQRSQLSTHMYNLMRVYKPQTLLLTATPIRSTPWNLHTLLTFCGNYIDHKKWRDHFFELKKTPYLPRPAWLPKKDWRKMIRPVLAKYSDIVLLSDCVGEVPPITEEKVIVEGEKFENTEWEGSKAFFEEHRHEQIEKPSEIIRIAKNYRKMIVVAYYREQVDALQKELSKHRETFAIYGGIKDQEKIIEAAQESDECFFIVQASLGAGFDGDKFSGIIFASMSYSVRDFVQMKFRVRRIHNLHPVIFFYLLGGRCDRAVFRNIQLGKDFVPSEWKVNE